MTLTDVLTTSAEVVFRVKQGDEVTTSAQVVKTSVNVITISPSQDYTHPVRHASPT